MRANLPDPNVDARVDHEEGGTGPVRSNADNKGWSIRVVVVITAMLAASLAAAPIARATTHAAAEPVSVFPTPGSHYANPATTISFRGVASAHIGTVEVDGATTGSHAGRWIADSDGLGASFVPATHFSAGERVTVHTHLDVRGGSGGTFSFVVTHPSSVVRTPTDATDEPVAPTNTRRLADVTTPVVQSFRTRPDLLPPVITPDIVNGSTAPGYIAATPRSTTQQSGLVLFDNTGQIVWDQPAASGDTVLDLKVTRYRGQDVLAWWHGQDQGGHGAGEYVIDDDTYRQIATVRAGNGFSADLHDMVITPQNTALLLAYAPVAADLSAYGGPVQGTVLELVVQEVDIATGAVLLEWHSLDHVPLSKTWFPVPTDSQHAWDYMHGNAIALDTDGNILVSARHTSQVYKINRTTGALIWTLGQGGDFTPNGFADSDWFGAQHDVRRRSDGTLSVFDNGNAIGGTRKYSRGLAFSLNEATKTASIVKIRTGPGSPQATSQGDFRELPGGDDILGWGNVGQLTELDAAGNVRLDMRYPFGVQSYRSVRVVWHAHPTTRPTMVVDHPQLGTTRVAVSWNGATEVARWVLAMGPDLADLSNVASSARTGFETTLTAHSTEPALAVIAFDAHGTMLGSTATGPALPPPDHTGYLLARANGSVRGFGTKDAFVNATVPRGDRVVGLATAPQGGYWIATARGDVIPVQTPSYGTLRGVALRSPIVGIAATRDGRGYWLVGADGGIFAFGTARFQGSAAYTPLRAPIVGITATSDGRGYWLVGADGGIFAFGTAGFYGSTASTRLRAPIVGITATSDGRGYWLVGADGGIFAFGTARFHGSAAYTPLRAPIVGITATHDGRGYWLVGRDGGIFAFGSAHFRGGVNTEAVNAPVVAIMHN